MTTSNPIQIILNENKTNSPMVNIDIIKTLSNKELFYKKYMDNGIIDLPKTIYYNLKNGLLYKPFLFLF